MMWRIHLKSIIIIYKQSMQTLTLGWMIIFFVVRILLLLFFFLFQHEELICLEYVPYDICYRFRLTFLRCTLYQDQQVHQVFAGMNQSAIHRVFSVYIFRFAWIFLVTANLSPFLVCLNWMPLMRFRLV